MVRDLGKPKVLVCQHGARHRYAVPRMFEEAGMLVALYTDSSAHSFLGKCAARLGPKAPPVIRRLANRKISGIPVERIFSSDICMLDELGRRYTPSGGIDFSRRQQQRLSRKTKRWGLKGAEIVYTMQDEDLDFVRWAKDQGASSVVDVIISPVTEDILQQPYEEFPDWAIEQHERIIEQNKALWQESSQLADLLLCPSEWVAEGVRTLSPEASDKIRIVPYGCSIDYLDKSNQPVEGRVLFAGGDALRKGLHYLASAATRLKPSMPRLDIRIAGELPDQVISHAICKDLNFLGKLTSGQMKEEFLSADCFVLPSLSEGFAGVVAEAISAGCPVIVTRETGSPIVHEREGLIIPANDERTRKELFGDAALGILYSGTIGQAHVFEMFIELARRLRCDGASVAFCFAGRGNRYARLQAMVSPEDTNVRFADFCSLDELECRLNAADLHMISLRQGWEGSVVPSKFFGALAAGKPLLYDGSQSSDIGIWINQFDVGILLRNDSMDEAVQRLKQFVEDKTGLEDWKRHVMRIYQQEFSREQVLDKWNDVLMSLL